MPRTGSYALGGLPLTLTDVYDIRTHGPRMRLDDLPCPSRKCVARDSASTATVDSSPGRGGGSGTADYSFASFFAVRTVANEDSTEAPAATTSVAIRTPSRSWIQVTDPVEPTSPTAPVPTSPRSPAPQTLTRFSNCIHASLLERAGVQQQPLARHPLLSTMASEPAGSPGNRLDALQLRRESDGRGQLRLPPRPLLWPTHRPARYHFHPTMTMQNV